jgi:signal transduction histidine kinase
MNVGNSMNLPRIFLVDDDECIRRSLGFYFRRKKVPFFSFATAEEALEQVREQRAELIITDYNLPGLNGLELIQELNAIDPGFMKILITAYGNMDIAVEAMRLGVHDMIRKPFNTETIESAINALTQKVRQGSGGIYVDGRRLEESRELRWRARLEFAVAKISHKINNSLHGIIGNAELGLLEAGSEETIHKNLRHIIVKGREIARVNERLMSLCRESTETSERIDLSEVIRECAVRFGPQADRSGIGIVFEDGALPFLVEGRKSHLEDIVENVVLNSIQELSNAGKPDKKISIAYHNLPHTRSVLFFDNGNGIEPALLEKITQKGFTTKPDGHGLGLYIVSKLAEEFGASFAIRSEPGTGTTVEIGFPLRTDLDTRQRLDI